MSRKKLVLVDIDNTLVRIDGGHFTAMEETVRDFFGISYDQVKAEIMMMQRCRPQDLTAEHPMLHLSIAMRYSEGKPNLEMLHQAMSYYENRFESLIEEMPGARDFLINCQEKNIPVVAITNNYMALAIKRLVKTGLSKYISGLVSPEHYGVPKPEKFLFQIILKDHNCAPSDVLMVGDNIVTDGGCADIGIDFELIRPATAEEQYKNLQTRYL